MAITCPATRRAKRLDASVPHSTREEELRSSTDTLVLFTSGLLFLMDFSFFGNVSFQNPEGDVVAPAGPPQCRRPQVPLGGLPVQQVSAQVPRSGSRTHGESQTSLQGSFQSLKVSVLILFSFLSVGQGILEPTKDSMPVDCSLEHAAAAAAAAGTDAPPEHSDSSAPVADAAQAGPGGFT